MTPLLAVVGLIAKFTSIFNDFPPSKTRQPLIITKESGKKCHINLFLIISLTIILILTAHNALTNGRENTVHFKAAIYMKLWHFTNSQDTHSNKHFHTVCELSLVSPKLYHLHDILGRYKQLFVLDLIQEEQETSLTETPSRLYDGRITVRFSLQKSTIVKSIDCICTIAIPVFRSLLRWQQIQKQSFFIRHCARPLCSVQRRALCKKIFSAKIFLESFSSNAESHHMKVRIKLLANRRQMFPDDGRSLNKWTFERPWKIPGNRLPLQFDWFLLRPRVRNACSAQSQKIIISV